MNASLGQVVDDTFCLSLVLTISSLPSYHDLRHSASYVPLLTPSPTISLNTLLPPASHQVYRLRHSSSTPCVTSSLPPAASLLLYTLRHHPPTNCSHLSPTICVSLSSTPCVTPLLRPAVTLMSYPLLVNPHLQPAVTCVYPLTESASTFCVSLTLLPAQHHRLPTASPSLYCLLSLDSSTFCSARSYALLSFRLYCLLDASSTICVTCHLLSA